MNSDKCPRIIIEEAIESISNYIDIWEVDELQKTTVLELLAELRDTIYKIGKYNGSF